MKVTLSWQNVSGATSQKVEYQIKGASTWTEYGFVDLLSNNVTISDLLDNYIYLFRVVTTCNTGSPATSATKEQINIVCPTVVCSGAASTISYSFSAIQKSITGYTVKLYDNAGTTLLSTQSPSFNSSTTTITGTFSALTPSTGYKVELTITADTFTKTCSKVSATTTSGTACDTPQSVTALIY
jgi:hypothetical protein